MSAETTTSSPQRRRLDPVALLCAATVLAFLLPFATVSCDEDTVRFTGIELATRTVEPDAPNGNLAQNLAGSVEESSSVTALMALVLAACGVASALVRGRGGGFATMSLLALLGLWLDGSDSETTIELGGWLALAAAAAATVTAAVLRDSRREARRTDGPQRHRAVRALGTLGTGVAALVLVLVIDGLLA